MNPFEKDVLTTGEVANNCNVASRTVSKWFDSGQIRGYRIPGSKDRRIPVNNLTRFMKSHGIPMDGLMSGSTRVLPDMSPSMGIPWLFMNLTRLLTGIRRSLEPGIR